MAFTVLGAVAELERSLIVERVKTGLRKAKAKGKQIGRPKIGVDPAQIVALRSAGRSWSEIATQTGWTKGTVQRAYYGQKACPGLPKNNSLPKSTLDVKRNSFRVALAKRSSRLARWKPPQNVFNSVRPLILGLDGNTGGYCIILSVSRFCCGW